MIRAASTASLKPINPPAHRPSQIDVRGMESRGLGCPNKD
jgi:hypothetical protein